MKPKVGLWIDHRKAIIVIISDNGEELKLLESDIKREHSPYRKERFNVSRDRLDVLTQPDLLRHFQLYYNKIIPLIRDADSILIFGPGEAKFEFRKRLIKYKLGGHIEKIEAADKMSNFQILDKVRKYYKSHSPAVKIKYSYPVYQPAVPAAGR